MEIASIPAFGPTWAAALPQTTPRKPLAPYADVALHAPKPPAKPAIAGAMTPAGPKSRLDGTTAEAAPAARSTPTAPSAESAPELLSAEERDYFDRIASLGPLTYGPNGTKPHATTADAALKGRRLDVRG